MDMKASKIRAAARWPLLISGAMLALLCLVSGPSWAAETTTYVLSDVQGTVLAREDAQGAMLAQYDYRPYGQLQAGPATAGPGYTGHVADPDSGLVYMQARYYDSDSGRFLSVDPLGPTGGNTFRFNRYGYANNNPVNNVDIDGRQSLPLSNELGTTDPTIIRNVLIAEHNNAGKVMGAVNQLTEPLMFAYPEADVPAMLEGLTGLMGFGSDVARVGAISGSEVPLATELSTFRMTTEGETFFHYSKASYANSFAGGMRPGGFATNVSNLTNIEAQSGLALPHATVPDAVYTVTPQSGTWVNMNPFIEPLNGEPGGLTEWTFPQGTGPGTVSAPRKL